MTRSTTRRTTNSQYDDDGAPGRPGAPLHVVRWGRMSRWAVLVLITLAHALGARLTLGAGQAVIGILMLVAALAGSLRTLLACLVLAGFGFSVLNPSTGKAVLEWFPPRGRGLAMGIKQTGLTLGGLVGALALPPAALVAGWRAAVAAGGPLA